MLVDVMIHSILSASLAAVVGTRGRTWRDSDTTVAKLDYGTVVKLKTLL
jgi:hypothetical protein